MSPIYFRAQILCYVSLCHLFAIWMVLVAA